MPGRTPSLCYHRGKGQFYIRLDRRQIYLGADRRKARKEADRLIGEWLANGRRLPTSRTGPLDLTVSELANRYRTYCRGYYRHANGKPTSEYAGIGAAIAYLRQSYGPTLARLFSPLALQAVRQRMIDAGLCRGVVNQHIDRIRRMFKWAVSQELLPVEVHQALSTVAGLRRGRTEARETEPITPVSDTIVEATLSQLPETVAAMVQLQGLTGMRPQDVCRLRPAELDRSGTVWEYRPAEHKTAWRGKTRSIFIGPKAQAILLPYLLRDAASYCFVPRESETKRRTKAHEARQTPLGQGNEPGTNRSRRPKRPPGASYSTDAYRRAIHRAADKADQAARREAAERGEVVAEDVRLVPRWSPNRLRHSAATKLRKRYGIEGARLVLGHSDPGVTLVYAEADLEKARQIMGEVG